MKTTANGTTAAQVNTNRENTNARTIEQVNNKIEDFGAKIGGARKDLYQAANEWAAKLAGITPDALTKAGGVSKLLHLPNLEKMTEAGAITADQARAALIVWRGIERKPQGIYRADRWAERTRARLEAVADILTSTEPTAENVADIITAARESAEFAVITAANWPAVPFTFGAYSVKRSTYSTPAAFRIIGGGYYRGTASTDPADIAAQLREMTAADAEKAADRRAAGPALGVYRTSNYTRYFIAVEGKCEIILKVCDTYQEATEAARNERAALLERYEALRNFPALRRSWNRPRVGKEWHAEDVTPEQFAAVLPFKGVEFGNWLNQQERAALLNSAFDGFHDLADLLGIPAAAVTLGGRLSFSFATRGHANSAAHFDSCYNTINLNKRNGAGCMAHEWLHACDHYAAELAGRGGCGSWGAAFSTEYKGETLAATDAAARRLIDAIRNTDFYTRSGNYQAITGKMQGGESYYTMPCELAARGFEGVVLYLLTKAGACSDFLVNLQGWQDFERDDAGHRRDCYPYPSDAEAAALLPYYIDFFRALFGRCEVSKEAAAGVAAATLLAQQEKAEADRAAAEKAAKEKAESEARRAAILAELNRKAEEQRKEQERKAEERKQAAAHTVEMLREVLTARHFDAIATAYDAAAVYAVAHLEGEIYTLSADIETANREGRAYIENRPAACVHYKRVHNAKRVICRRWQVPEIRANKWNARELCEALSMTDARGIVRAFVDFEKAEAWQRAAKLWEDTQRLHKEQAAPAATEGEATQTTKRPNDQTTNEAPAEGLQLIDTADGVAVIGNDWRDTYFNKKQIKAHGATWNKERKQWEATAAEDVASLRAWFALRESNTESTESTPAATLQDSGEITAPEVHTESTESTPDGVPALPEWLAVGARVRTRGRYMMTTHSRRPEWVEGEAMTVRAIGPDFVELESRDESGTLRGLESIATATAADQLAPIYSASEKSEEPAAIAASYDTAEPEPHTESTESAPEGVTEEPAAIYENTATEEEQQQAAALPFMEKAAILDKVTARIYAPWGDVSKMWLCPFRGAYDVWSEWARRYNFRDCGRLADWALTAKAGERAEYRGVMVQIWERDGQTAADPQSEADRLRANRETRERLRAAIASELEAAGIYIYPLNNEVKIFGKVKTAADLSSVEDIARRYPSAQYRREGREAVFEFNLPLFFPHYFPTDPTPDPSGEGVGKESADPVYSASEKSEPASVVTAAEAIREKLGEMGMKQSESRPAVRVGLYDVTNERRTAEKRTTFNNEQEAREWLEKAANGTGALEPSAVDIIEATPYCVTYYSKRNYQYICMFICGDNESLEARTEEARGHLTEGRREYLTKRLARDIRATIDSDPAAAYLMKSEDNEYLSIMVTRDNGQADRLRVVWMEGDQIEQSTGNHSDEEAAEQVLTFFDAYNGSTCAPCYTQSEKSQPTKDEASEDTPCYSTSEKSEPTTETEPTRNQEIAKIILQQLGGRQFAMMTGAKQFVAIDSGVRFRIGRNKTRANLVKVVLRGDDTYNMEFWHIGQEVNPYTILMRYADKGLSGEEFNKQVKAATERAQKAAEPVKLKAYEGIYCDQLQELFTEYTELYTRLF